MTNETLRMQMLSGVITESEYKAKLEESKKDSLNEHYVAGGIVGIGAINQIPSRVKADYEDAFEYFLSQKYSLNEIENAEEAEVAKIDPEIAKDPNFKKLVDYFKQHPDEAEKVKDEIKSLSKSVNELESLNEGWFKWTSKDKERKGFVKQEGVTTTRIYKEGDKYYKQIGQKVEEISKKDYKEVSKEWWKEKGVHAALSAAAVGLLGSLIAGPLGANDPGSMLQAIGIAAGIGVGTSALLREDEEVEEPENY
jgi:hypothetical protein